MPNLLNYVLSAFLSTFSFGFRHIFFPSVSLNTVKEKWCASASRFHQWKSFLQKLLETFEQQCSWCILGRNQTESHLAFSDIMDLHWWIVWVWFGGQLVAYKEAFMGPKIQIKFNSTLIHNHIPLGCFFLRENPTHCDAKTYLWLLTKITCISCLVQIDTAFQKLSFTPNSHKD